MGIDQQTQLDILQEKKLRDIAALSAEWKRRDDMVNAASIEQSSDLRDERNGLADFICRELMEYFNVR